MSLFLAIVLLVLPLFSCHTTEKRSATTQTPVVLRLKWRFNASTLGELWAKEKGIYSRHGLKVELKEGGAEYDALTELELGRVEFGVASLDQVIRAVAKGATPVVLLQIFQKNPLQWIFIKERTKMEGPEDLKGKTVGITFGGNDEAIFRAIMKRFGLTEEDLNLYAVHYDYGPFWKGEVDLWPVYRNTQGVFLTKKIRAMGDTPGFFDPHAVGITFVANCLVTSRAFATKRPDVVKKMMLAEAEAWIQALSPKNEEEAIRLLKQYDPTLSNEILRAQVRETRKMVLGKGGSFGTIDKAAWIRTAQIMAEEGLIVPGENLDILHFECKFFENACTISRVHTKDY